MWYSWVRCIGMENFILKNVFNLNLRTNSHLKWWPTGEQLVNCLVQGQNDRFCGQEHLKPEIIMDYKATKGGIENVDKLVTGYTCNRRTLRWTLPGDNLQHLGHLGVQHVCHLDGVEPRLEQREAPEETALSRRAGKGIGKTSNPGGNISHGAQLLEPSWGFRRKMLVSHLPNPLLMDNDFTIIHYPLHVFKISPFDCKK